jgi:hypothetical protein
MLHRRKPNVSISRLVQAELQRHSAKIEHAPLKRSLRICAPRLRPTGLQAKRNSRQQGGGCRWAVQAAVNRWRYGAKSSTDDYRTLDSDGVCGLLSRVRRSRFLKMTAVRFSGRATRGGPRPWGAPFPSLGGPSLPIRACRAPLPAPGWNDLLAFVRRHAERRPPPSACGARRTDRLA